MGGINGYVYVENNSLYWVDPTGECFGLCTTGIGIGVGIGGVLYFHILLEVLLLE